jgi:hypothetical protein
MPQIFILSTYLQSLAKNQRFFNLSFLFSILKLLFFMQRHLPGNRLGRWLVGVVVAVLVTFDAQAQLTGNKTIPGSYATLATAIADLNAQGVGAGGVTFNIVAGYTETAANLLITASGTAANPIVFQKSGAGANPEITAGVGTGALDAIIGFSGVDYVTLDGLSLVENAANATATTQMEFGIALFRPSPTDGCQFNTIRNCQVTLNKANTGTFGVYGAATTAASTTSVAAIAPSGANTGNRLNGNTISNAVSGIYLTGSAATTAANYDLNNEIGVTAGNTVTNFGGASTSGWGIGVNMQNGAKIVNNTVNSAGGTTGTATLRGIYANTGVSSNIDITGNTITLVGGAALSNVIGIDNGVGSTAAGNTVNITGNTVQNSTYATATSGAFYGIQNTASATIVNLTGNTISGNTSSATMGNFMALRNTASVGTLNISTNNITNNTLAGSGEYDAVYTSGATSTALVVSGNQFNSTAAVATTGSLYFLNIGATSSGTMAVRNNVFGSFTKTGVGGTVYGYYNSASPQVPQTISGNTISGITLNGATAFYGLFVNTSGNQTQTITGNTVSNIGGGTSTIYGLYVGYGSAASTINTNTVTGLSAAASVYGLYLGSSLIGGTIYANTIGGLSGSGTGSAVVGLYTAAFTPTIYGNKVYNLADSHATGLVYGLCVQPGILPGTTVAFYNNQVGDLRAPAATSLNAVVGLYINSGATSINAYYNTFYLAASSTEPTFGTSGIYLGAPLTVLDARNNIVVNKSTAAGAGGYTAALRRVSGAPGSPPDNLAATANNNLYYAGPPSATNVIYVEGITAAAINAQPTLAAYRAFMAPRESNTVTEDLAFASTAGLAATFLHVNPAAPTQIEGGGTPIGSITTDFDGDTRSTSTPDIGADEGTFLPLNLTGPLITLAVLANTSSTATRSLAVTITDPSGLSTTTPPRLFYRKGTSGAFVSVLAASQSGSTYTFALDYAAVGGVAVADVVQYYVVAQDASGNVSSNPLGGTFAMAPARQYQYTILGALSGVYYVGSGTSPNPARTYATLTAAAAAYNGSGLTGAVTFLLLDATYSAAETFPVIFGNNPEASAANTLTIRPHAGVSSTITAANSLLAFSNARYVTLDGSNSGTTSRDLTLTSTTNISNVFHVFVESPQANALGTTNITVRNLNIVGRSPVAAGGGLYGIVADGADNDNLTVQNNSIVGVTTGISLNGSALVSAGGNDNTVVQDNVVGPATASAANNIGITGLAVSGAVNITVTGNIVQNVFGGGPPVGMALIRVTGGLVRGNTVRSVTNISPGYAYGLTVSTGTTGLVVDANRISGVTGAGSAGYGGYGIWVYTGMANSNVRISNNFVSDIQGTSHTGLTTGATVGILLNTTMSGVSVQYNSVNLTGTYNYAGSFSTAFGVGASVTGLNVHNNIFANAQVNGTGTTGSAYTLYSLAPAAAYTTLNYNDYHSSGPQAALAYFGGATQATLAALRTATGKDVGSISVDPRFISATDLHTSTVALNGAATPIPGIMTDIDGDTRNATTPAIGADEFTLLTTTRAGIAGASLLVYPNPTPTGRVTLELRGFRSATQLAVLDALGRLVSSELVPASSGSMVCGLDLTCQPAGVYLLRLRNEQGVETRRLVRE